ncbi:TonB family protein [Dysgonomonas alginatilytica]|uniref:TonB family protein n=1 Tax=Dysgonomonas alginatilytica TaxID=1605892 RepID=A0A2V3PQ89_9BACT|nr:energy transducer TonB [Dysgonomonas alginatilytica]PXV64077.1 TonB family protein [Dysgonomonas alginatilytica]
MKKLALLSSLLLVSIVLYSQDKKLTGTDSINTIFSCPIENMPQFPGGNTALMKFVKDNLTWPAIHNESSIEGRVVVKFVVRETGELSDIEVVRSLEKYLDEEAIRIVKLMPKWIPGERNGKKIPCPYTLPVLFKMAH